MSNTLMTPIGRDLLARQKSIIKPGPVNAETSDEEIAMRARVFGHDLAVPYQVLEHIMKIERRLARVENVQAPVDAPAPEGRVYNPMATTKAQVG